MCIVRSSLIAVSALSLLIAGGVRAADAPIPARVSSAPPAAEDWKGPSDTSALSLGALTGLGVLDGSAGFALYGTASKKLIDKGFVSDISNAVSLEAELGPLFISGSAAFAYGLHLRWDFSKDDYWCIYALGGLGGDISGRSLGDRFELYPRFGVGAIWRVFAAFNIRAEVSHELIALGVNFPI